MLAVWLLQIKKFAAYPFLPLRSDQGLLSFDRKNGLKHRWAWSSFLGRSKDFFARGGHKKLKQQGVRGSHAKIFIAVLALSGQELVPA